MTRVTGPLRELSPQASTAPYIPSLDGIRCVAVSLVILSHALFDAGINSFIPGNLGVTVFFFLSGYLITTLLRIEREKRGNVSIGNFMLRRALRILPPFYLVFFLALAAALIWDLGRMDGILVTGQFFHLTNYILAYHDFDANLIPGTDVLWSLAVEEHFYIIFPVVFLAISRLDSRKHQAAVLLAACIGILLWRCWLIFGAEYPTVRTYVATDARADSILFGCALALYGNPYLDSPRLSETLLKRVLFPLSLALLAASVVIRDDWFTSTIRYTLQGVCLFPVFMVCVRFPRWGLISLLNLPWIRWLGVLSYSMYLVHRVVFLVVWEHLQPNFSVYLVTSLAATVAISALIYAFLEKPMLRFRKRLAAV